MDTLIIDALPVEQRFVQAQESLADIREKGRHAGIHGPSLDRSPNDASGEGFARRGRIMITPSALRRRPVVVRGLINALLSGALLCTLPSFASAQYFGRNKVQYKDF